MSAEERRGISRRGFLKGAAAGTAAVVGAGVLSGCKSGQAPKPTEATGEGTPAPITYSFEVPPPPIPESEIKETVTAEIVVVGAGTSGVFAALGAAEKGAKVIVIEKTEKIQGRGGDNTALNSRKHKELGITLDADRIVRELMKWGDGRLDMRLLYLWAHNSGPIMDHIMDILAEQGLETYLVVPDRTDEEASVIDKWPNPTGFPEGWNYLDERVVEYPTCHRPGKKGTDQVGWLTIIANKAQSLGAEFRFKMKAEQLLRPDNGRVTGVVAKNEAGEYVKFVATKAVLLCTGDYGANPEMVAKYTPEKGLPGMLPTSMGEGHQMGMWIGAVMENLPHCPMSHLFHSLGTHAFLQVNKYGERFYCEDSDTESMANQAVEQGGLWVVIDDSWTEDIEKMGIGFFRPCRATDTIKAEFQKKIESGTFLKADTIEELATKMQVPVDTFKATVDRYNELVKAGKDLDFGKRPDRLTAVDKPPFYAAWTPKPTIALVVLGGLLANDHLQALDAEHKVIPGLYLAGNTVGRRFKGGYPVICPGLSHSMAWTHGYLAGQFAADEQV